MEAEYEQLTKGFEQDIKQIDEQITLLNKNKLDAQKEKQREYADIKEENYVDVTYSEEMEDLSKERKEEEEKVLKQEKEELSKINDENIRIETKFNTSCDNLKKIGKQEPIPANQIKGNYEERKGNIEKEKKEGIEKRQEYLLQNDKIQKKINKIEQKVGIDEEALKYIQTQEMLDNNQLETTNLKEIISEYDVLRKENQTHKNGIYRKHTDISNIYKNKHRIANTFLENVSIKESEEENYDTYYYIYEKLVECLERLDRKSVV